MRVERSLMTGRVAIVTGASRGIGRAIAQELVDRGAKVCITARKAEPLEAAARTLGDENTVLWAVGGVDDPAHRQDCVDKTLEAFGRIDMLVNNSGVNPVYGPLVTASPEASRKVFEINVTSALEWVKLVHERWMAEHGGAIVNLASVAGQRPSAGIGVYGTSKAALQMLTQQLAWELAPGVRVNAVAPAVIQTRFAAALYEGRESELADDYPLGRLGIPEDVGAAVAFLLSDESAWITGQTVVIDGGLTLTGGIM